MQCVEEVLGAEKWGLGRIHAGYRLLSFTGKAGDVRYAGEVVPFDDARDDKPRRGAGGELGSQLSTRRSQMASKGTLGTVIKLLPPPRSLH